MKSINSIRVLSELNSYEVIALANLISITLAKALMVEEFAIYLVFFTIIAYTLTSLAITDSSK